MDADAMPLPSEDTPPPVIKIYFVLGFTGTQYPLVFFFRI